MPERALEQELDVVQVSQWVLKVLLQLLIRGLALMIVAGVEVVNVSRPKLKRQPGDVEIKSRGGNPPID